MVSYVEEALAACHGKTRIAVFLSLSSEPDTAPLIEALHRDGKTVLVPVGNPMAMSVFEKNARIITGVHGTKEPREQHIVAAEDIDLFFVPGTAFDTHGNRRGRGQGHYDRYLAQIKGKKPLIGLCMQKQFVKTLQPNPWDVPMDSVIVCDRLFGIASLSQTRHAFAKQTMKRHEDLQGVVVLQAYPQ